MPDMLAKLYNLPEPGELLQKLSTAGVSIRRAIAPEKHLVTQWVSAQFNAPWASECEVAFAHVPVGCFIAVTQNRLLGFACYDATQKGFFGPTGVSSDMRGRGVGAALLLAALHAMRAEGYGYAIIGAVGPAEFYTQVVGATLIDDSSPGIYRGLLRTPRS
jgi:predicted GNAT family acetyltransferase